MQTIPSPATFGAIRHQPYENQVLPSFSSLVISNSSVRMKSSSMSIDGAKIRSFALNSEDETFQLLPPTWPSNSSAGMKPSNTSINRARVKPSSFHNYWWKIIDYLSLLILEQKRGFSKIAVLMGWNWKYVLITSAGCRLWAYSGSDLRWPEIYDFIKLLGGYVSYHITRFYNQVRLLHHYI